MDFTTELEDGEISSSSEEVYVPLQRPSSVGAKATEKQTEQNNEILDEAESTTDHSDSSSDCIKDNDKSSGPKKRTSRTVMLRVQTNSEEAQKRARFKRFNIWTSTAEEDSLTENMRGCDVTHKRVSDRSVESYDYRLVNGRKRRRSISDDETYPAMKRGRDSCEDIDFDSASDSRQRQSVKSRLSHRLVLDLDNTAERDSADIGREMANKLFEEKDELLIRVVEVLGVELATEIYNETQRIEAEGGMLINNGARRRTPGGVFLFLLKNHEKITLDERRTIFEYDRQNTRKSRKEMESVIRDRKVEELKERLSRHENLPALCSRKELLAPTNLNAESANLSNPPPSPVIGQENSPEQAIINHDVSLNKPSTSATSALRADASKNFNSSNDDLDFLDLHSADMDLF